jgi:GT2 family glycosyltransferase
MTGSARVTVVVASHNRRADLMATLPRHEAPVVLVDNGSTDGTAAAVRAECPGTANIGAAARNVGALRAKTPYVAFADDDSWWAQGALERAADILDAHLRLGLLAARVLVGPELKLDPTSAAMERSPLGVPTGHPGPAVLGFLACGVVVRRTAFREVGGFAELLFVYGEEELLAVDLAAAGWQLAYVPEVLARHCPSPRRAPAHTRVRQERRNALLTSWQRRPTTRALADTMSLARAALRDNDARAEALRRAPAALARRRPLPAAVEAALVTLESARR